MERYTRLRRRGIVERIEAAVARAGAEVVSRPDPTTAPFELTIRAPQGELIDLVCYAFTANKYRQHGRPPDEHRFQIKYGSEFDRYHYLYFDPQGIKVTLMVGVHLET